MYNDENEMPGWFRAYADSINEKFNLLEKQVAEPETKPKQEPTPLPDNVVSPMMKSFIQSTRSANNAKATNNEGVSAMMKIYLSKKKNSH